MQTQKIKCLLVSKHQINQNKHKILCHFGLCYLYFQSSRKCSSLFGLKRVLDIKRFEYNSDNQNSINEMITGMQDIKLFNAEKLKSMSYFLQFNDVDECQKHFILVC